MTNTTEMVSPYGAVPYGAGVSNTGLGGVGLVGLIGLNSLGRGGLGVGDGATDPNTLPILGTLADLRKDTQEVATEVHKLGNELVGELHKQTIAFNQQLFDQTIAFNKEFCDLNAMVADVKCTAAIAAKEAIIEGLKNTQAIKDSVKYEGEKTRELLTNNKIEDLRDALAAERRHSDRRETDIQITNVNTNTQNQLQSQLQTQSQAIASSLNLIGEQINRQTNSVVNLGSMIGNAQTASSANTKVNA